eukprot:10426295-Karenia_brevis.AAC.1
MSCSGKLRSFAIILCLLILMFLVVSAREMACATLPCGRCGLKVPVESMDQHMQHCSGSNCLALPSQGTELALDVRRHPSRSRSPLGRPGSLLSRTLERNTSDPGSASD